MLIIILVLLVAALTFFLALWHNEILSVMSIERIRLEEPLTKGKSVYTMEMKGGYYLDDFVKEGGVSSDSELVEFISSKVTKGLLKLNMDIKKIGCTSFTSFAENGDFLHGRNFDLIPQNVCVVKTEGVNGRHSTISTVSLDFLNVDASKEKLSLSDKIYFLAAPYMPLDGINSAGVSCNINSSYQSEPTDVDTPLPDITTTTLIRLILDYADDIDEAIEIAKSYDLHESVDTTNHYMIADKSGRSAVLEWINGNQSTDGDGTKRELHVIYSDADSDVGKNEAKYDNNQVMSNYILAPGYYDGSSSIRNGAERSEIIWKELDLKDGKVSNEEAAFDILESIASRAFYNNGLTVSVYSTVYNLTKGTAEYVFNEKFGKNDRVIFSVN